MKVGLILALVCLVSLYVTGTIFAEEVNYTYGTVSKVNKSGGMLTITEYDWDTGEEMDAVYIVGPDVETENIDVWHNVPVGGEIDVEYEIDDKGNKVIKYIALYTDTE